MDKKEKELLKCSTISLGTIKDNYENMFIEKEGCICRQHTFTYGSLNPNQSKIELSITLTVQDVDSAKRVYLLFLVNGRLFHCNFSKNYGLNDINELISDVELIVPMVNSTCQTSFKLGHLND